VVSNVYDYCNYLQESADYGFRVVRMEIKISEHKDGGEHDGGFSNSTGLLFPKHRHIIDVSAMEEDGPSTEDNLEEGV
jgi:hypothetical protein